MAKPWETLYPILPLLPTEFAKMTLKKKHYQLQSRQGIKEDNR